MSTSTERLRELHDKRDWSALGRDGVAVKAALAALIKVREAKPRYCAWAEDADGTWFTECGNAYTFAAGQPCVDGVDHCCYCGASINDVPFDAEGAG